MTKRSYIPQDENGLHEWLKNFSLQLKIIGVHFGITPSEISSLNVLIKSVKDDIIKGYGKQVDKIEKKDKVLKFVGKYIDRIMAHPSYNTNDHGKKLKIASEI
jgi:hypothetical protein